MLEPNHKPIVTDQRFLSSVADVNFQNHIFVRLVATKVRFAQVDFNYAIFDSCYFRDCTFDSCTFVGCRFTGTNAHASKFIDCNFKYCTFEKTTITSEILETCAPDWDNVRRSFARTLRINFQQLGDAESANKAILVELEATRLHLLKSWRSSDKYYRDKYSGLERFLLFIRWISFEFLQFIWGNGESAWKLLRSFLLTFVVMSLIDVHYYKAANQLTSYGRALVEAPQVFFGVLTPPMYPKLYLTILMIARLSSFGFLTSIILKRTNRR